MITTQFIESMDMFYQMLEDSMEKQSFGRYRSPYVFRGMPDSAFHLITSLRRNCKERSVMLEKRMLESFRKYAIIEDPSVTDSVWMELILGQHHGLPTRLLDWTLSPLVAAHFATSEDDMDQMGKHDCVIWRISMNEMDSMLPKKYIDYSKKRGMDVFSFDMLAEICESLAQYDRDMGDGAMLIVEPPSIESRIVNQYSFFAIVPNGVRDVETFLADHTTETVRYIISKDIRWQIRDALDSMNISERMIYPGLDGICRWLARHYFYSPELNTEELDPGENDIPEEEDEI